MKKHVRSMNTDNISTTFNTVCKDKMRQLNVSYGSVTVIHRAFRLRNLSVLYVIIEKKYQVKNIYSLPIDGNYKKNGGGTNSLGLRVTEQKSLINLYSIVRLDEMSDRHFLFNLIKKKNT